MPDDPITLGELSRRFDAMEHRFEAEFGKLGRSIDSLRFVHLDMYRAESAAMTHRIEAIEADIAELRDDRKWDRRAIVTAFLFPIAVAAILAVMLGGVV